MKRFQNRVAESRYALSLMVVYALGIWYLGGLVERQLYFQLAFLTVSTYLMMELNNSNALIRIYSRMVSCSFLALTTTATFLFPSLREALVQLCLITFYTIIFHTYQDKEAPGLTFYAFLCLGIASVLFVQVLFFVPFLWLLIGFKMMAFSFRMFCASLIGLLTPYWFLAPMSLFTGHFDAFVAHFIGIAQFRPLFQYQDISEHCDILFRLSGGFDRNHSFPQEQLHGQNPNEDDLRDADVDEPDYNGIHCPTAPALRDTPGNHDCEYQSVHWALFSADTYPTDKHRFLCAHRPNVVDYLL